VSGGGVASAAVAAKQWQMKLLPSCSSQCLSNLFSNLSTKDQFPLEIKGWSRDCGAGVFAACDIPQGATVCSYLGELVSDNDMSVRESHSSQWEHTVELEAYYKCWSHLKLRGRHSYIDADRCGNTGRYLNHACGSSVNLQRCILEQHGQAAVLSFVASRDIVAGQELRWNYFSGKEGKDQKKLMWWGACCCPDCTADISGRTAAARRRKTGFESD
jgi:SET domain-containing protein